MLRQSAILARLFIWMAIGLTGPVRVSAQEQAAFRWQAATPESQGMSRAKLEAIKDRLVKSKTDTFLVARNDKIVYEWYADDWNGTRPHGTASLAKAIVGGLSLAVAITDGKISVDDPAAKFITQWRDDPQKSNIKIRHLGSHTSGIEDAEADDARGEKIPHEKLTGWKGDFWKRLEVPNDPFSISRDRSPVIFEPGAKLAYSNPGIGLMTYAVTAAIKDGPQSDIRSLLRERVLRPIAVPDNQWSCGYGKTYVVDGLPLVCSWGGGNFSARATASIGRLVLHEGNWDGREILSREAVQETTRSAGLPGDCGMGWWTNAAGRYARLPRDAFWGAGAGDQLLLVVPSLNLIMVRNGQTIAPLAGEAPAQQDDVLTKYHDFRARILFEPLVDAVDAKPPGQSSAAPYPPSKAIAGVQWAPKESIIRTARGGDNWPLTWGDDGHLYAAYGDANGFEPKLPVKLSTGLARIEGNADDFRGFNLRSPTFEQTGDGPRGKKASGLLMVDGVLYALLRNADVSQIGWSRDHGQTWTWPIWRFTSRFGCPTFLNFGPNYAGARDDYVYIYSHDSASAYRPADGVALARIPRDRMTDPFAYEYYLQTLDGGLWSKSISLCGHVFSYPGKCYRTTVTYNAGLRRYLLCQIIFDEKRDPRFAGGFGIYESQQPWGPWATVYHTTDWDVGPGETCSLPTKWMSPDGLTMHLVFSGDDCFSVRRLTLVRAAD